MDDFLCDNIVYAKQQFERDIANLLAECDGFEIRAVKDMAETLIDTLRRDAKLRNMD